MNLKYLTEKEEAQAKAAAYQAFQDEMGYRFPKPQASIKDLVHENRLVSKALCAAISFMPAILGLIMASSLVISADRTFKAFSDAATSDYWLWATLIGLLGVVMTEGSLVFSEFAAVRQRLQKGLKRRVVTLPTLFEGLWIRLGRKPSWQAGRLTWLPAQPLDYDEMPDTGLEHFARLVFLLVLVANVFTATFPILEHYGTNFADMGGVELLSLAFAVFIGVCAPLTLKIVGAQMAQMSFEMYRKEQEQQQRNYDEEWRTEMDRRWQTVEEEMAQRALHRAFIVKNKLSLDAPSPYLLLTSGEEDAPVEAVPLASSSAALPAELLPNSPRGNRTR